MPITLVRHTRPDIGTHICYGQTDLSLADTFDAEADSLIANLKRPGFLITSPLLRCRHLADRIGKVFDLQATVDIRIQEMNFGAWEERPWSEIPKSELDEWGADFLHARPHGGESVAMLRARVLQALTDYRRNGDNHIVVTHGGVIRTALAAGDAASDFTGRMEFGHIAELG